MLQQETVGLIARIPAFDRLPEAEIEGLVEGATLDYFPRGEKIFAQGGPPCDQLYVIKRGTVSMSLSSDADREVVLDYRGEGEYFGLISAVSGDPPRRNGRGFHDAAGRRQGVHQTQLPGPAGTDALAREQHR